MILSCRRCLFIAVLLLVSSSAVFAQRDPCPGGKWTGWGCNYGSNSNPAAGILSRYSHAQDEINNTFNQFRSILANRRATEPESDAVPDYGAETDQQIEADIEQRVIEREAREAAEAARRIEEQRNREAASLIQGANDLLQTTDPGTDCAALMSTYYSGTPPALPSECMTDAERMSVYTPGSPQRITAEGSSEPLIDGSNIPSVINFSPALQELTSQITSPSDTASQADPLKSLLNRTEAIDQGPSSANPSPIPPDEIGSQSADQTQGPSVLDQLRDTAVKDCDSVKQSGQSVLDFVIEQAPKTASSLTDPGRTVVIPNPAADGASFLIRNGTGLPSVITDILGDQIANRLESTLLNQSVNWGRVNADPDGQVALDVTKSQAPYKVYQRYDYPVGILKVLDQEVLPKFNDSPQADTSNPNQ